MMNCLPILATPVMTALGATAAVSIIIGVGKTVIDAIDHHGGHHEK